MSTVGRVCRLVRRNNWSCATTRNFSLLSHFRRPTPPDVATQALEVEAVRAPLERSARLEELVERIQNLAADKENGQEVDESEISALEAEFLQLKSEPDLDPEQFKARRLKEWSKNPEARAQYVRDIEERRAFLHKYAVNKGEAEVQSFTEMHMGFSEGDIGLPSEYCSRGHPSLDPTMFTPALDVGARAGIFWDLTPAEVERRYQNLPAPETEEFVNLTFVDSKMKVHKNCKAYVGETLTLAALRNKIPIEASCSEGTAVMGPLDHSMDVGCDKCQMRLEPELYKQVAPPMGTERAYLKKALTTSPTDRLGCMVYVKKSMANSRVYVPPT